jgi:SAM-dependent methyltransferase
VLAASRERILRDVDEAALVLDVGGWARPLSRADWVIDLMPYATRGRYGEPDPEPERFTRESWVVRDICAAEPWPFDDDSFDFVVCSHTLEDVRDPIRVCAEICRVGRAGYVEVPSRLEEQAFGVEGPWAGWGHHRWLIDLSPGRIEFVFKSAVVHGREGCALPGDLGETLSAEERVQFMFWTGGFEFSERTFFDGDELERYLAEPLRPQLARLEARRPTRRRSLRRRLRRG